MWNLSEWKCKLLKVWGHWWIYWWIWPEIYQNLALYFSILKGFYLLYLSIDSTIEIKTKNETIKVTRNYERVIFNKKKKNRIGNIKTGTVYID